MVEKVLASFCKLSSDSMTKFLAGLGKVHGLPKEPATSNSKVSSGI